MCSESQRRAGVDAHVPHRKAGKVLERESHRAIHVRCPRDKPGVRALQRVPVCWKGSVHRDKAKCVADQKFNTQVTPIPSILHWLRENRRRLGNHQPEASRFFTCQCLEPLSDSGFLGDAYGGSFSSGLIPESFKCNHALRKNVFLKTLPIMA